MGVECYLIIVARDRPELFQKLGERYGDKTKVILDRRSTPRPALPAAGNEAPGIREAAMRRYGFMFVRTRVVKRAEPPT